MMKCVTCGNPSCNGGYGTVNGEVCKDCPSADEEDKIYHRENPHLYEEYKKRMYEEKLKKDE